MRAGRLFRRPNQLPPQPARLQQGLDAQQPEIRQSPALIGYLHTAFGHAIGFGHQQHGMRIGKDRLKRFSVGTGVGEQIRLVRPSPPRAVAAIGTLDYLMQCGKVARFGGTNDDRGISKPSGQSVASISRAARSGSWAWVIGRPMTMIDAPASIAPRGVTDRF